MLINPISYHSLNRKPLNNFQPNKHPVNQPRAVLNRPLFLTFRTAKIPFAGVMKILSIKDMEGVPCLCCSVKMVNMRDYKDKLTKNALSGNSSNAVETLEQFAENMHTVEKTCFELIKEISATAPTKTLQEILLDLRQENFEKLKTRQFEIFDEIYVLSQNLSQEYRKKVRDLLIEAKKVVTKDNPHHLFKRKTFISNMKKILEKKPEHTQEIINAVNKLNTPEDDLRSLIIKYSKRTSKEIGQRLVFPSIKTREHLIARNPIEGAKGTSAPENIAYTCEKCNSEEKGNDPIWKWAIDKPQMCELNAQGYFNFFIHKILNGETPNGYLETLKKTAKILIEGSKGRIKIDTAKLEIAVNSPKQLKPQTGFYIPNSNVA